MEHACRASTRLNSLSETESAVLNSVVTEEDEEGEESKSSAVGAKHMLGAHCSSVWHDRLHPAMQSLAFTQSLQCSPVLDVSGALLLHCGSQAMDVS